MASKVRFKANSSQKSRGCKNTGPKLFVLMGRGFFGSGSYPLPKRSWTRKRSFETKWRRGETQFRRRLREEGVLRTARTVPMQQKN